MKLLGDAKEELQENKVLYQETLSLSTQLTGLSKVYGDKKTVIKSINRILKQSSLRSSGIKSKNSKTGIVITAQSIDKKALNSLMAKILNGSYNVYSCKIKKLSDKKSSFKMEIKW